MFEKFKKVKNIYKPSSTVIEPKRNLVIVIIVAACFFAVLVGIYFFTGDIKYLVIAVISFVPLIIYAVFSYFKEKRQDKSSEKDKQEFLSGAKYRQKEWKAAYYQYKEKHSFETISKKGMVYDLKKRYRKNNMWVMRLGLFLIIGSVFILFIPATELKDKAAALFGIILGGILTSVGFNNFMGSAVKKFLKQQTDLTEIENSYTKGKMLSLGDNGKNIGSSYIVIYTHKSIYAIDNNTVQDMTRKMVRVKQYEDNLYSGQEYRYFISLIYTAAEGKTHTIDVRLDEFQCEMMIAEFYRRFCPEKEYDSKTSEITENSVSV